MNCVASGDQPRLELKTKNPIFFLSCCKHLVLIFSIIFLLFGTAFSQQNYFQQYVNYEIDAKLLDYENAIEATQNLIYVNNSPQPLKTLYFHLYFNKYEKGAYTPNGTPRRATDAFIQINALKENGEENENYFINKTLMLLNLKRELAPGDSVK